MTDTIYYIGIVMFVATGWLIILLFENMINNFFYHYIGLDVNSTLHSFIVFAIVFGVFIIILPSDSDNVGPFGWYGPLIKDIVKMDQKV